MLVNDAASSLRPLNGTPSVSVASMTSTCSPCPHSDGGAASRPSGHSQLPSNQTVSVSPAQHSVHGRHGLEENDLSRHMQHSGNSIFTSNSAIRDFGSGHMHSGQQHSDHSSVEKCDVKDSSNCGGENADHQQHCQQVRWMSRARLMAF